MRCKLVCLFVFVLFLWRLATSWSSVHDRTISQQKHDVTAILKYPWISVLKCTVLAGLQALMYGGATNDLPCGQSKINLSALPVGIKVAAQCVGERT